jgi:hypothetical protein
LKEIIDKLNRLDEKVTNFMGFFDLSEEEREELERDLKSYKEGKLGTVSLEEAEKLV